MASSDITAEVVGGSIGEAYTRALGSRLGGLFPHRYRLIHIAEPITSLDTIPDTLEWDAWQDIVHAGEALSTFEDFEFTDSSTGGFWVQDRIEELFSGLYASRLTAPRNQIEMITDRLKQGNHGQTTNALVAQSFQLDPDLEEATHGRPLAPDIACLTQVQVRPDKNRLNMYATFRSQYLDTECYGNLISLAMLLAIICDRTGYEPGYLVEVAHNTTFRNADDARRLYTRLTEESKLHDRARVRA